jgi:hypothetical protein
MKKIIMLSAAAAALAMAGQANAAKVGNDSAAWYNITGTAGSYCVLGQSTDAAVGGDKNVTVDTSPGALSQGGTQDLGGVGSDGLITITSLQNQNAGSDNSKADTAAAWRAVFNLRHSICNSAYTITAHSDNGALEYQGSENGAGFTKKLGYTIQANFDGKDGNPKSAHSLAGTGTLFNSGHASIGNLKLIFDGAADHSAFLLAGDYTDQVQVTITPNP